MPGYEGTQGPAYLRVDVRGVSADRWAALREELLDEIKAVLGSLDDKDLSAWFEEKAEKLNNLTLDIATQQMQTSHPDAARMAEEVQRKFAKREREQIKHTREMQEIKRQNDREAIRKLTLRLKLTRAIVVGEQGDEAILFGNQLTEMIDTLELFSQEA